MHELVDKFHLKGMLDCKQLREVCIDGIYTRLYHGHVDKHNLTNLEGLGKWMIKEFRKRGQEVKAEFVRRPRPGYFYPCWQGRLLGTIIELNDDDDE